MRKKTGMVAFQTLLTYIPIIAAMILIIVLVVKILNAN